jgi:hypothetical protein
MLCALVMHVIYSSWIISYMYIHQFLLCIYRLHRALQRETISACSSVYPRVKLENICTDFDEIWSENFAFESYTKIIQGVS